MNSIGSIGVTGVLFAGADPTLTKNELNLFVISTPSTPICLPLYLNIEDTEAYLILFVTNLNICKDF